MKKFRLTLTEIETDSENLMEDKRCRKLEQLIIIPEINNDNIDYIFGCLKVALSNMQEHYKENIIDHLEWTEIKRRKK